MRPTEARHAPPVGSSCTRRSLPRPGDRIARRGLRTRPLRRPSCSTWWASRGPWSAWTRAVDESRRRASRCEGRANVAFHEADATSLPVADAEFDAALACRCSSTCPTWRPCSGEIHRVAPARRARRGLGRGLVHRRRMRTEDRERMAAGAGRGWDAHLDARPRCRERWAPSSRAPGSSPVRMEGHSVRDRRAVARRRYGGLRSWTSSSSSWSRRGSSTSRTRRHWRPRAALALADARSRLTSRCIQFCFAASVALARLEAGVPGRRSRARIARPDQALRQRHPRPRGLRPRPVPKGAFFGLLGPNGAGKTTAHLGRLQPDPGDGRRGGSCSASRSGRPRRASSIGLAEQDINLDRFLTVRETLIYHGGYFGMRGDEAEERADEMIEVFSLGAKSDVRAPKLSGGQRRRLLLARALMHPPEARDPRRADGRRGLRAAPGAVDLHPPAPRGGHHDPPHHALPRGGRGALRGDRR